MKLFNGIELPPIWPPRYGVPDKIEDMPVPYLAQKPQAIDIDTGRQLFVDSFLIHRTDMRINYHQATFYSENPVLSVDKEWENTQEGYPYAAPFSDGVWYDEEQKKFRMWYMAGGKWTSSEKHAMCTCYAESTDGLHWVKPMLDVVPGTNIVDTDNRDSCTVWLDKQERDQSKRYKMFLVQYEPDYIQWQFVLKYSSDGIHWSGAVAQSGAIADRSTAFYNPFTQKWGLSMRHHIPNVSWRARAYLEHADPEQAISLAHRLRNAHGDKHVLFWFTPDTKEKRRSDYPVCEPGIYNFDAIAYESIMLGLYSQWQGPENDVCKRHMIPKHNEIQLGYSRDGFHFYRPVHDAFAGVSNEKDAWNYGNMQSVNGTPLIVGDRLYFYFSGRRKNDTWWDAGLSTGAAFLRRDGFASLDAHDDGYIETEPLTFTGKYLFVNAQVQGTLLASVLDCNGHEIPGFTKEDCIGFTGDSTKKMLCWQGGNELPDIKEPVRFLFTMKQGSLYAFWVAKHLDGASGGFTAGGGKGLNPCGIDVDAKGVCG